MKKYQVIKKNQLMWCKVDTKNGAFGVTHDDHVGALASTNMALAEVNEDEYLPQYIETLFQLKPFYEWITKYSSGSTNRKYLTPQELMVKIEIPELSRSQQEVFQRKVNFLKSCGFYSEITHQQTLLKKLRQRILLEAIEGKLTADWRAENPDVEPVSELLKRIASEKAQLVKDKKIRKQKRLPPITENEKPFELPEGWAWCRLGQLVEFISGNNFLSTEFRKSAGAKCIKITNAGVQKIIESEDRLPIEYLDKYARYLVFEGDIVLALTRPYIAEGLKVSLCTKSYDRSLLNQRVAVIRPNEDGLQRDFCYLYLLSDFVLSGYKAEFDTKGQQPNLKKEHVTQLRIPLPPLPEQKAIVAKVRKLLNICDQMEAQFNQNQIHAEQLMQAVLKEAFRRNAGGTEAGNIKITVSA